MRCALSMEVLCAKDVKEVGSFRSRNVVLEKDVLGCVGGQPGATEKARAQGVSCTVINKE